MKTRLLLAVVVTGALLTAGCAQADPETPVPSSSPSDSPTPTSQPSTGAPSGRPTPAANEVTVTGMVEIIGVEGGCRALRGSGNKTYELMGGDPVVLKAGARVSVRGKIRTDLMTICQIGPVLEVISAQPA